MPKISFVIATKNRANLINDSLNSLLAQTEPDWEAIVVDDHGNDNTREVVEGFGDPRIFYYRLPEGRGAGIASARNYGNMVASSNLIAVLDSDDLAKPDRAQRAIAGHKQHSWDFYSTRRETVGNSPTQALTKRVEPEKWDAELFKTSSYVTHSSVVYTKKAIMEIPYNSALPCLVDYDMISRFIEAGKKMYYDPVVTVTWRRHDHGTVTGIIPQERRLKFLTLIRNLRGWTKDEIDPKELV